MQHSKVGICGFRNLGNTCYMNSILQLLVHCKPIINFLYKNPSMDQATYKTYLERASVLSVARNERKKQNLDINAQVSIERSTIDKFKENTLTPHLAEIIQTIMDKGSATIAPITFKNKIDTILPTFRGSNQHDAHEFLISLIDKIFDETCIESEPTINNIPERLRHYIKMIDAAKEQINTIDDINIKKSLVEQLNKYKNDNLDMITKYNGLTFMMKYFKNKYNPLIYQLTTFIQSSVKCCECNFESIIYEPTTCLQLDVTDTLTKCFDQYIKEELLENDSQYFCTICKKKQNAYKSAKIWRLPKILFIQLKRFTHTIAGVRKNSIAIEIPYELDISPYMDQIELDNPNNKYKLIGFSNHHGGLGGGHYTADALDLTESDEWYHFDDSSVSKYNGNKLNTSDAYVLMYEAI